MSAILPVLALEQPLDQFVQALAAARNRGLAEVSAKNAALTTLVDKLEKVADALETTASENEPLILGAGFMVRQVSGRSNVNVPVPEVVKVFTTGQQGEVKVQLSNNMQNVLVNSAEYSDDKGATWKNGAYRNERTFVLETLPSSLDLWLRFRSIGRNGKISPWTKPVSVAVL